ncbi:MAG: DUF6133 family protein [Maledivibacter sp.]|jgi:hypothetical protein|uniref:DUF4244 domain-containing protein n=1 Tax=Alkaliphilus pronyensis TaxID=1482732 RepID=A0A6I0F2K3_9FIRM|nr:DUF6133 family protein [Alkaliphilus pronyensis]KAB3536237.1 hypothetical protein F8154_03930 [Alkaliphilus pronyensis]MCT4563558.1 DUF6133 family protein [Maledivibacter sp.]
MKKLQWKIMNLVLRGKMVLADKKGEGALNTAITVLISVVLGALLLAGLYALIGDVVLPQLKQRIIEMFNFNG